MGDVESLNDVYKRAEKFIDDTLEKHLSKNNEKILVITHGGFMTELIHALKYRFLGVKIPVYFYPDPF
jgi:broad specificity phosphatase PhoE